MYRCLRGMYTVGYIPLFYLENHEPSYKGVMYDPDHIQMEQ